MDTVLKVGKQADPQDVGGAIFTLMGHNVFHHQTLISAPPSHAFDGEVGQAAAQMKMWLGYKEEDCVPTYGPRLDDILLGRAQLTKAMHQRRMERGFEQPPVQPAAAQPGLVFPVTAKNWTKLGFPFQGTHAKDFNKKRNTDNWQSENAVDIGCPKGSRSSRSPTARSETASGRSTRRIRGCSACGSTSSPRTTSSTTHISRRSASRRASK
jgi:hypothetical protein